MLRKLSAMIGSSVLLTMTIIMSMDEMQPLSSCDAYVSGESTSYIFMKGKKKMKDIYVGEKPQGRSEAYLPIFAFEYRNETKKMPYVSIETAPFVSRNIPYYKNDGTPLLVGPNHLIYVPHLDYPVPANTLKVGDKVSTFAGPEGMEILNIQHVEREGAYQPINSEGSIIFNGIITSNYNSFGEGFGEVIVEENDAKEGGESSSQSCSISSDYIQLAKYRLMPVHEFLHLAYLPYQVLCTGTKIEYCDWYDQSESNWYTKFGKLYISFCRYLPEIIQLGIFGTIHLWLRFFYMMTLEKTQNLLTLVMFGYAIKLYRSRNDVYEDEDEE